MFFVSPPTTFGPLAVQSKEPKELSSETLRLIVNMLLVHRASSDQDVTEVQIFKNALNSSVQLVIVVDYDKKGAPHIYDRAYSIDDKGVIGLIRLDKHLELKPELCLNSTKWEFEYGWWPRPPQR